MMITYYPVGFDQTTAILHTAAPTDSDMKSLAEAIRQAAPRTTKDLAILREAASFDPSSRRDEYPAKDGIPATTQLKHYATGMHHDLTSGNSPLGLYAPIARTFGLSTPQQRRKRRQDEHDNRMEAQAAEREGRLPRNKEERERDQKAEQLHSEFNALSDEQKLLHYAVAAICRDDEGAAELLRVMKEDTDQATLAERMRAMLVRLMQGKIEQETTERQQNEANSGVMRIEPLTGEHEGTAGVYLHYADKQPNLGFTHLEMGDRRISAEQLFTLIREHGIPIIPKAQDVTAHETVSHGQSRDTFDDMGPGD